MNAPTALPGLSALASALPPARLQDELWDGFFAAHFGEARWAHRVFSTAGVRRRHPAVDPTIEDISGWSTAARLRRYLPEAMPLAKEAAALALAAAGADPADISLLALVSCTGYTTPGADVALARDLGLPPNTQRALFGHMGCHAVLPALSLVADHVARRQQPALLLSVELPSLHVQPATGDTGQVLAHALFSDGAAAAVVAPQAPGQGLAVMDVEAFTDVNLADHITWEVSDLGFRMGLSRQVPALLARHVGPVVDTLLSRQGYQRSDVGAWAVHPGGLGVLEAVGGALGLPDRALDASRRVLVEHGNCSSATVLLVLEELARGTTWGAGQPVVLLAFGPGLTVYAVLVVAGSTGPYPAIPTAALRAATCAEPYKPASPNPDTVPVEPSSQ